MSRNSQCYLVILAIVVATLVVASNQVLTAVPSEPLGRVQHGHRMSGHLPSAHRVRQVINSEEDVIETAVALLARLSDYQFHQGDHKQTILLDRSCFTLDPHQIQAYTSCSWLEWSLGRGEDAIKTLNLSVANNPVDYEPYYALGSHYFFYTSNYCEALPWLEKAAGFPCPFPVKHTLAHCYERLGKFEQSVLIWEQRRLEEPGNGMIFNNLVRVRHKMEKAEKK